jgi:hypothetical protein
MTTHHITIRNRFNNSITAQVVRVKDMGDGCAEVDVETNYHIELGHDQPAIYVTPGHEATGRYKVDSKTFTERLTYLYVGMFTRE